MSSKEENLRLANPLRLVSIGESSYLTGKVERMGRNLSESVFETLCKLTRFYSTLQRINVVAEHGLLRAIENNALRR